MASSQFFQNPKADLSKQLEYLSEEKIKQIKDKKAKLLTDLKEINLIDPPGRDFEKFKTLITTFHEEMGELSFKLTSYECDLLELLHGNSNLTIFTLRISRRIESMESIKYGNREPTWSVRSIQEIFKQLLVRIDDISIQAISNVKYETLKNLIRAYDQNKTSSRSCVIL
ncbi:MAG: hypothetical protein ACYCQI_00660 [Gammaproteobacteria bacterium]